MVSTNSRFRLAGWSLGGLLTGALLATLGWGLSHPARGPVSPVTGRVAPDLNVRTFDGRTVAVADFRGRPLVLHFWASWCSVCRTEAPVFSAAAAGSPDIAFLDAAMEDSASPARAFQARFPMPDPVGLDADAGYLRYGVTGPPETYFIDRSGVVRYRQVGPLDAPALQAYLDKIRA
jgi:cytochrome c biogenesis protein CcmG/thiol:disulfide interchange protein DsbE